MKSYTDLEQSKKLAKILDKDTADGFYCNGNYWALQVDSFSKANANMKKLYPNADDYIPCWSLAALLEIIPKKIKDFNVLRTDISEKEFSIWYDEIGYGVNTELPDITMKHPVDVCVEMIVKLHELKML